MKTEVKKSMENMPGIKLKTELALLFPLQLANDITILKNRYFSERWKKTAIFLNEMHEIN